MTAEEISMISSRQGLCRAASGYVSVMYVWYHRVLYLCIQTVVAEQPRYVCKGQWSWVAPHGNKPKAEL